MTASGLVFTVFLTLSKVQSAEYDPGFLAFFRSFIALILTLPVIIQQGWGIMRIHQPGMVLLRVEPVAFIHKARGRELRVGRGEVGHGCTAQAQQSAR